MTFGNDLAATQTLAEARDLLFAGPGVLRKTYYLEDAGMRGDYDSQTLGTDNAPFWNNVVGNAAPGETFLAPPGLCGFQSKPMTMPDKCSLIGSGGFCAFVKAYQSTGAAYFFTLPRSYPHVERISFVQGTGMSGGTAIGHTPSGPGDDLYGPVLEDITISGYGGANWHRGLMINASSGTPNYGARNINIRNIFLSSWADIGMLLIGIVGGIDIAGLKIVQTGARQGLYFGGSTSFKNNNIRVSGWGNGDIYMDHVYGGLISLSSVGSLTVTSRCVSNLITGGYFNQTPSIAGTNNRAILGRYEFVSPA